MYPILVDSLTYLKLVSPRSTLWEYHTRELASREFCLSNSIRFHAIGVISFCKDTELDIGYCQTGTAVKSF
jgi:hypothetical protein